MFKLFTGSDESDGWETVQRGGKVKQKTSPSQRSMENLHTASRPQHKLTRSVSDPNACIDKYRKKANGKGRGKLPAKKSLTMSGDTVNRPRADSKDSEKENRPDSAVVQSAVEVNSVESVNANGPVDNKSSVESVASVTDVDHPKPKPSDKNVKSASVRKSTVKPVSSDKPPSRTNDKTVINTVGSKPKQEEKSHVKSKVPNTGARQNAWAKPLKVVEKDKDAHTSEVKTSSKEKLDTAEDEQISAGHKTDIEQDDVTEKMKAVSQEKLDQVEADLVNEIDNVSCHSYFFRDHIIVQHVHVFMQISLIKLLIFFFHKSHDKCTHETVYHYHYNLYLCHLT